MYLEKWCLLGITWAAMQECKELQNHITEWLQRMETCWHIYTNKQYCKIQTSNLQTNKAVISMWT